MGVQFCLNGGHFPSSRFQAKILLRSSVIDDLLFTDVAVIVASSFQEHQELVNQFSITSKAFGLTIIIKKTEVVHHPPPSPKLDDETVHQIAKTSKEIGKLCHCL